MYVLFPSYIDELPTGEITLFGCEGMDAELSVSCPDGTYISITDAFYGRTQVGSTSHVCPAADGYDDSTTCRSTDTQAIVESYCEEQRTCSIPVSTLNDSLFMEVMNIHGSHDYPYRLYIHGSHEYFIQIAYSWQS